MALNALVDSVLPQSEKKCGTKRVNGSDRLHCDRYKSGTSAGSQRWGIRRNESGTHKTDF